MKFEPLATRTATSSDSKLGIAKVSRAELRNAKPDGAKLSSAKLRAATQSLINAKLSNPN